MSFDYSAWLRTLKVGDAITITSDTTVESATVVRKSADLITTSRGKFYCNTGRAFGMSINGSSTRRLTPADRAK